MKAVNFNIMKKILVPVAMVLFLLACKKTKMEELNLPRQFKPGTIRVTAGETTAKLDWVASQFSTPDAEYTVEVSEDTTFQSAIHYTTTTNSPTLTLTESELDIEVKYFARVKANAFNTTAESGWVTSNGFMITGEQVFFPLLDVELKDVSATLRWRVIPGLTRIVITPAGGTAQEITLDPADTDAGLKLITGLTPLTQYTAAIFQGSIRKGIISFTTKEPSIYTRILTPADNLIDAIAAAEDGDAIGLEAGTYNSVDGAGAYANLVIQQKSISISSVSNNPNDTKVNFREITLKGTGAGVKLQGIGFDGLAAGSSSAYFLNLVGNASDGEASDFKNIVVDNCIVSNMGNCFFRGNRASNNAHKIDTIRVVNSIVSDSRYLSAYTFFTMEKLEFESLELINSTFYRLGRAFIGYSTNITVPLTPQIRIENSTINSFGRDGRNNFFVDANANQLNLVITNSIIANTPMAGQTTGTSLVRGSNAVATLSYSNIFNLSDGAATPTDLVFPALVAQSNNLSVNLGWTEATNDFSLPAASELRTASSSGGPIGDPRWAF